MSEDNLVTIQIDVDKKLMEKLDNLARLSGVVTSEQIASVLIALYLTSQKPD
jgi:hypothetical protein